ncbi:MAG: PEGA domain-containing protein [Candidatus Sumerlaeia bacterium]|nr:PEGA domain-containing protein [Candidatus Sumerlaeia bacterium]
MTLTVVGCGTKRTFISIETRPTGAQIEVNGEYYGESPVKISLEEFAHFKHGSQSIKAKAEGYTEHTRVVNPSWYTDPNNHTIDPRTGELGYRLHIHLLRDTRQ